MLTITVNGHEQKMNIGCRTFVNLDEMLKILEANDKQVTLNGETIRSHEFVNTSIKGGDTLGLELSGKF
ncbi:MAG: hypothetical protein H7Y05_01200 [Steroidobacteraceae bacterium]|nr:hypothetical protein [Deltaproteobacteria bacterium]